ncbi:MAG: hypothetical protein HY774_28835 [Acidobacteria bacterium]|nr:hypothetical protein [Acidobacteriota bacterium]
MAREIVEQLVIQGVIEAETPLHVGGAFSSSESDLPLARNGKGIWYIPGTSLSGVFRAWCERHFGKIITDQMWGDHSKKGEETKGRASLVTVADAVVCLPKNSHIEIRDGVGIDRVTGTAADRFKFDRAVLPRGSHFGLNLRFDLPSEKGLPLCNPIHRPLCSAVFGHLAQSLQKGEFCLGAAKTRGLGQVRLVSVCIRRFTEINRRQGMLALLRNNAESLSIKDLLSEGQLHQPQPGKRFEFQLFWQPRGPVMVKAGYDGIAVDSLPLVSAYGAGQVAFVLPGSSIKGTLRSHAERIMRTVFISSEDELNEPHPFPKQLEVLLAQEVFGMAAKSENTQGQEKTPKPGLGALSVADCFAEEKFTRAKWDAIETVAKGKETDEPLMTAIGETGAKHLTPAYHVSIDRWTGGASDSALFSVLEPHGISWEPIKLRLNLERIEENKRLPALGLVLLVLNDVLQGRIPFGFAVNRGMGEIEVERIELSGTGLDRNLASFTNFSWSKTCPLPADVCEHINLGWRQWIADEKERTRAQQPQKAGAQ